MEREYHQFSPKLLQMMRDEERDKFLTALKNGASWGQLYQIRNTIRKLNEMIETAESSSTGEGRKDSPGRNEEPGPRSKSNDDDLR